MPYLADFECKKCNVIEMDVMFKCWKEFEEMHLNITCKQCGGKMQHIILNAPNIEIKEGHGMISNKPTSYWRNAERNRLSSARKRGEAKKEKVFYEGKK